MKKVLRLGAAGLVSSRIVSSFRPAFTLLFALSLSANALATPYDDMKAKITVTGGTTESADSGNAMLIKFTSTSGGSFTMPAGSSATARILVVGGGGSGSSMKKNGGAGKAGAGGKGSDKSNYSLSAGAYTVTVGSGGASVSGSNDSSKAGNAGGASSVTGPTGFTTISANGGTAGPTSGTAPTDGWNESSDITGSSVTYGKNGQSSATNNTGHGGAGASSAKGASIAGSSGIVVVKITNFSIKETIDLGTFYTSVGKCVAVTNAFGGIIPYADVQNWTSSDERVAVIGNSNGVAVVQSATRDGVTKMTLETAKTNYTLKAQCMTVQIEKTIKDNRSVDPGDRSNSTIRVTSHVMVGITEIPTNTILYIGSTCTSHGLGGTEKSAAEAQRRVAEQLNTLASKGDVDWYLYGNSRDAQDVTTPVANGTGHIVMGHTNNTVSATMTSSKHRNLLAYLTRLDESLDEEHQNYDYVVLSFDSSRLVVQYTTGKTELETRVAKKLAWYYTNKRIIWITDPLQSDDTYEQYKTEFYRPSNTHDDGIMDVATWRAYLAIVDPNLLLSWPDTTTAPYTYTKQATSPSSFTSYAATRNELQATYDNPESVKKMLDENVQAATYDAELVDTIQSINLALRINDVDFYTWKGSAAPETMTNGTYKVIADLPNDATHWAAEPASSFTVEDYTITANITNLQKETWNKFEIKITDNGTFLQSCIDAGLAKFDEATGTWHVDPNDGPAHVTLYATSGGVKFEAGANAMATTILWAYEASLVTNKVENGTAWIETVGISICTNERAIVFGGDAVLKHRGDLGYALKSEKLDGVDVSPFDYEKTLTNVRETHILDSVYEKFAGDDSSTPLVIAKDGEAHIYTVTLTDYTPKASLPPGYDYEIRYCATEDGTFKTETDFLAERKAAGDIEPDVYTYYYKIFVQQPGYDDWQEYTPAKQNTVTITDSKKIIKVDDKPQDPTAPGGLPTPPGPENTGDNDTGVKNVLKVYDGIPTNIVINVTDPTSGEKILYSLDNFVTTTNEVPTFTNIGTNKIYYAISATGYLSVTNYAWVTIIPRPVTVTADNKSKVYGAADPELTATVDGTVGGDAVSYTLNRVAGEDVSGSPYAITPSGDAMQGNYSVTYYPGYLTITKKPVNDPLNPGDPAPGTGLDFGGEGKDKVPYKGTEWEPAVNVTNELGTLTLADYDIFYFDNIDSTNKAGIVITGKGNYSGVFTNYFEITKLVVTITADNKSIVYGSAVPETSFYTFKGEGFTNGETIAILTVQPTFGSAYTTTTPVGSIAIEKLTDAAARNYTFVYVNGTLTITKESIEIGGKGPFNNENPPPAPPAKDDDSENGSGVKNVIKTYDGEGTNIVVTVTRPTSGSEVVYSVDGGVTYLPLGTEPSFTNAVDGTQVWYVVSAPGCDPVTNYAWVTVKPAAVTITSATDTFVYNGLAQSNATAIAVGFVGDEGATYSNFATVTDVDDSETNNNTFDYTLKPNTKAANYNITVVNGSLTVTPLTGVTVDVVGNKATKTYNGEEQSVTGYTMTPSSTLLTADLISGPAQADAVAKGTDVRATPYTMGLAATQFSCTSTNFKDVQFVITDGELTIEPLQFTLDAGGGAEKFYDGDPTNLLVRIVEELPPAVTPEFFYSYSPTGPFVPADEFTGPTNVLESADVTCRVIIPGTTNDITAKVTIKPRSVTLVAGSASKTFDNTPLTCSDFTIKEDTTTAGYGFVRKEGVTSVGMTAESTLTAVGTVPNVIDPAKIVYKTADDKTLASNYTVTCENGKLTVKEAAMAPEVVTFKGPYDADPHKVTVKPDGLPPGSTIEYSLDGTTWQEGEIPFTDVTNVTVYVRVTKEGFAPFAAEVQLEITRRPITLEGPDKEVTLDKAPLTFDETEVKVGGSLYAKNECFAYDDFASIDVVGKQRSTFTWTDNPATGAKLSNYEVTFLDDHWLTVRASDAQIEVRSLDGKWTYDGTAHGAGMETNNVDKLDAGDELRVNFHDTKITDTGTAANTFDVAVMRDGEDVTASYAGRLVAVTGVLEVVNAKFTDPEVLAPAVEKVYDADPTNAVVTVTKPVQNLEKLYSLDGVNFTPVLPEFTDVTNAVVWYVVKADNHDPYTNSTTVVVTPRPLTLTSPDKAQKFNASSPLTFEASEITKDGFAKDEADGVSFPDRASITAVGSTNAAFTVVFDEVKAKAGNYTVTKVLGTLQVFEGDKITIAAQSHVFDYTGTAQTWNYYVNDPDPADDLDAGHHFEAFNFKASSTITKPSEGEVANEIASVKIVDESGTDVTALYDGRLVFLPGKLTMRKGSLTPAVSCADAVKMYDGKGTNIAVTVDTTKTLPAGASVKILWSTNGGVTYSETEPSFTDVIEQTVLFRVEAEEYEPYEGSAKVTITRRPVKLVSAGATKAYDETPLTTNEVWVAEAVEGKNYPLAEGDTLDSYLCSGSQTVVGQAWNQFTFKVVNEAAKADVGKNYDFSFEYGILKVTPGKQEWDDPTPLDPEGTPYDYIGVYDGAAHTITPFTVTKPATGAVISYSTNLVDWTASPADYARTDVCTKVPVYFKSVAENYADVVTNGYITITQRVVTITSATDTFVYNGLAQSNATATAVGFVDGEGADYSNFATVTTVADSGVENNTFDYTLKANTKAANYNITVVNGSLTVKPADIFPEPPKDPSNPEDPTPSTTDPWTGARNIVKCFDNTGTNIVAKFANLMPPDLVPGVLYSTNNVDFVAWEALQFTNVCEAVRVYYRVTDANYNTLTNSAFVTITNAVIKPMGPDPFDPPEDGTPWAGATNVVKTYDGEGTNILAVYGGILPKGTVPTIKYSTDPNGPFLDRDPLQFVNVTNVQVYFTVEAPNYAVLTNSAWVTINPAPIKPWKPTHPEDPLDPTPPGPLPGDPSAWAGAQNIIRCFDNTGTNIVAKYGNLIPAGIKPEVLYSTNKTDFVLWEELQFTNVCDGVEVFFTVKVDNYNILTNSAYVTITNAVINPWTPDDPSDPTPPGPDPFGPGVPWAGAPNVIKDYDGVGTNIFAVSRNILPEGVDVEILYSLSETGPFETRVPDQFVDVTNGVPVYFTVSAPNYTTITNHAYVTINPGTIKPLGPNAPDDPTPITPEPLGGAAWAGADNIIKCYDGIGTNILARCGNFIPDDSQVEVLYSLDKEGPFDIRVADQFVNVTNHVPVYFTVSAPNYTTITNFAYVTITNAVINPWTPDDPSDPTPPGPDPEKPNQAWAGAQNIVRCFDNTGTNIVAKYGNLIPDGITPEVLYSTNKIDFVLWEELQFTNVCDGVQVFFSVKVDNYTAITNYAYVTITNAVIKPWKPSDDPKDPTPPGPDPFGPGVPWAGAQNIVKVFDNIGTNITAVYGNILPEDVDVEILYSLSETGPFEARVADQFVNVTNEVPVYFTVSAPNYTTITNHAYVTILAGPIVPLGPNDPDEPFNPPAGKAWAGAKNVVKTYDGIGTNIVAEFGGFIPDNSKVKVLYALDKDGPFETRVPDQFVDVTNHVPVYFTVTAPNYGIITNHAFVTINPKSIGPDPDDPTKPAPGIDIPELPSEIYNGNPYEPTVAVTNTLFVPPVGLVTNKDYTIEYFNNTNATEEAYVVITGIGNYTGVFTNYFTILPREVTLRSGNKSMYLDPTKPGESVACSNHLVTVVRGSFVVNAATGVEDGYKATVTGFLESAEPDGPIFNDFTAVVDPGLATNYTFSYEYGLLAILSTPTNAHEEIHEDVPSADGKGSIDVVMDNREAGPFAADKPPELNNIGKKIAKGPLEDVEVRLLISTNYLEKSFNAVTNAIVEDARGKGKPEKDIKGYRYEAFDIAINETHWYFKDFDDPNPTNVVVRDIGNEIAAEDMLTITIPYRFSPKLIEFSVWRNHTNGTEAAKRIVELPYFNGTPGVESWQTNDTAVIIRAHKFSVYVFKSLFLSTPQLSGRIQWKYHRSGSVFYAGLDTVCTNGDYSVISNLCYIYEDRSNCYLRNLSKAEKLSKTSSVTYGGRKFAKVALDDVAAVLKSSPLFTTNRYGVAESTLTGADFKNRYVVPTLDERKIALAASEIVKISGGDPTEVNKTLGYLTWQEAGYPQVYWCALGEGLPPLPVNALTSSVGPLSVAMVNRVVGYGLPPTTLDSDPSLALDDFTIENGTVYGHVSTVAGGVKGVPGANARLRVLGAESVSGEFVVVAKPELAADGTFSFAAPDGVRFFKVRLTVTSVVK